MSLREREYRSRDTIYRDMLKVVKSYEPNGAIKIKILYGSRLSADQLKKHLDFLLKAGLLTVDESKSRVNVSGRRYAARYHITEKGNKYIILYDEMHQHRQAGIHI